MTVSEKRRLRAFHAKHRADGQGSWFECPKCNLVTRLEYHDHAVVWQAAREGGLWRFLGLERAERLRWTCAFCSTRVYTVTHEGRAHS